MGNPNNVVVQMVSADTDHQFQLIQYDQEIGSEMSCFVVCSVHFMAGPSNESIGILLPCCQKN
jgi:hypothetical protein